MFFSRNQLKAVHMALNNEQAVPKPTPAILNQWGIEHYIDNIRFSLDEAHTLKRLNRLKCLIIVMDKIDDRRECIIAFVEKVLESENDALLSDLLTDIIPGATWLDTYLRNSKEIFALIKSIEKVFNANRSYLIDPLLQPHSIAQTAVQPINISYAAYFLLHQAFSFEKVIDVLDQTQLNRLTSELRRLFPQTTLQDNFNMLRSQITVYQSTHGSNIKIDHFQQSLSNPYPAPVVNTVLEDLFVEPIDLTETIDSLDSFSSYNSGCR